jgi:hypothetical protein
VFRRQREIFIHRQQGQIVSDAKLSEEGIDRSNLNASGSALISTLCRITVEITT